MFRTNHIPVILPDSIREKPTDDVQQRLNAMRDELLVHTGVIKWRRIQSTNSEESPLVCLSFTGNITMNEEWCWYFRAQLHPLRSQFWLARPVYFDPHTRSVYLRARRDPVDEGHALIWSNDDVAFNPLVKAKLTLIYTSPTLHTELCPALLN